MHKHVVTLDTGQRITAYADNIGEAEHAAIEYLQTHGALPGDGNGSIAKVEVFDMGLVSIAYGEEERMLLAVARRALGYMTTVGTDTDADNLKTRIDAMKTVAENALSVIEKDRDPRQFMLGLTPEMKEGVFESD